MKLDEITLWFWIPALIVCVVFGLTAVDKWSELRMADKGYCYQYVERVNITPSWQYQLCK